MHYLIGVILPMRYDGEKLQEAIGEILKPWDENSKDERFTVERTEDGETWRDNPNGHWDWWQLGGRWTGVWSDYDPVQDPANHEQCWLCHGTGLRNDVLGRAHRAENPDYTCNGCSNGPRPGVMVKQATQWVEKADLDLVPVAEFLVREGTQIPYAVCMAPDIWMARETWDGVNWITHEDHDERALALLTENRDMFIAAVDIHS